MTLVYRLPTRSPDSPSARGFATNAKAIAKDLGTGPSEETGGVAAVELGWVARQRREYVKETLAPERQQELERLPTWSWDPAPISGNNDSRC